MQLKRNIVPHQMFQLFDIVTYIVNVVTTGGGEKSPGVRGLVPDRFWIIALVQLFGNVMIFTNFFSFFSQLTIFLAPPVVVCCSLLLELCFGRDIVEGGPAFLFFGLLSRFTLFFLVLPIEEEDCETGNKKGESKKLERNENGNNENRNNENRNNENRNN